MRSLCTQSTSSRPRPPWLSPLLSALRGLARKRPSAILAFAIQGLPTQIQTSVHIERHYAVAEIAEMWNLSADKVRELFENEPGVLVIGERSPRHKRRYVTLRIPQKVLERVHHRLSSKSGVR